jgi:hypothetical protein
MFNVRLLVILCKYDGTAEKNDGKQEILFHVDNVFTSVSTISKYG